MKAPVNHVLVVEDDRVLRNALEKHLGLRHQVAAVASAAGARTRFASRPVDLVVLDLHLPDGDGLDLIDLFRQDEDTMVIVITAYPQIQSAVRALKAGAFDYINKPFELDELDIVVDRALALRGLQDEVQRLRRQRPEMGGVDRILGQSPAVEHLRQEIRQVAATPATTVLIRGETGTGKELVAEAIHHESARSGRALVRLNCSSIPATMIESELFGHERGAFTDAKAVRRGLLEMANGGTLFLDEIGDLPLELQPKLLRVLESRRFRRLGGNREIDADVRFVAATNRDLDRMVAGGEFREDLLFRLKVFEIRAPPLRDRRGDIAFLARHFLQALARHHDRPARDLTPGAVRHLEGYSWPGNVRELRNVIEQATILARSAVLDRAAFGGEPRSARPALCSEPCPAFIEDLGSFPDLAEVERRYILCVYRRATGNKTKAAEVLGITRLTLPQKLRQYGIDEEGDQNLTGRR
ncbi:MAG: sigma-54-dependent Fis family transcriptional regulator [Candidatus Schekmanbacteria bacterium]|nr:sigma-54-dependent Fis family transcriptional regulator [Candidatus Schekmanbacteria bacterium]